jgi:hypothetical protein
MPAMLDARKFLRRSELAPTHAGTVVDEGGAGANADAAFFSLQFWWRSCRA